jgi:hypothetical protein
LLAERHRARVDPTVFGQYCMRVACQGEHAGVVVLLLADKRIDATNAAVIELVLPMLVQSGNLRLVTKFLATATAEATSEVVDDDDAADDAAVNEGCDKASEDASSNEDDSDGDGDDGHDDKTAATAPTTMTMTMTTTPTTAISSPTKMTDNTNCSAPPVSSLVAQATTTATTLESSPAAVTSSMATTTAARSKSSSKTTLVLTMLVFSTALLKSVKHEPILLHLLANARTLVTATDYDAGFPTAAKAALLAAVRGDCLPVTRVLLSVDIKRATEPTTAQFMGTLLSSAVRGCGVGMLELLLADKRCTDAVIAASSNAVVRSAWTANLQHRSPRSFAVLERVM